MKTLIVKYTPIFSVGVFGPSWEHAVSLTKLEFRRMEYADIRGVMAEGMVVNATQAEAIKRNMEEATGQARAIAWEWYGQPAIEVSIETTDSPIAVEAQVR